MCHLQVYFKSILNLNSSIEKRLINNWCKSFNSSMSYFTLNCDTKYNILNNQKIYTHYIIIKNSL